MIKELTPGVYSIKGKRKQYATLSAHPGVSVYGERRVKKQGREYRLWDATKSKLCAALHKGVLCMPKPSDVVLYLGASTGTTVSHVSDICTNGIVFAVEFAPRVCRDLLFLAKDRSNIAPILADANQVDTFKHRVSEVDWLFQDIAQRNQVEIFLKNVDLFLKKKGVCVLAIKARSIDSTKKPHSVFNMVKHELVNSTLVELKQETLLDPFQRDHCLYVCEKK